MRSETLAGRGPIIVSIFGPSNAGKSQLAKAVAVAVGEHRCARIPTDYFLNLPEEPDPNSPGALTYDWALLDRALTRPLGAVVTTPDVDFDRLVRRSPEGGLPFIVRPIMLTDAFVPHPAAAILVRLIAPEPVRRARVIARDARWGSRVIERWEVLEATWDHVAAHTNVWDMDLSGEDPLAANAQRILASLGRYLDDGVPAGGDRALLPTSDRNRTATDRSNRD